MIDVILIGNGNVAWHLKKAIEQTDGLRLTQQLLRKQDEESEADPRVIHSFEEIGQADICILAISDQALVSVATKLTGFEGLLVHTSGNRSLKALNSHHRTGVLYPIQTFTKGVPLDFNKVPLAIETSRQEDMNLLTSVAKELSPLVKSIDSDSRKNIHLAAIFANNFSNYMFSLAGSICKEASIPFDLLKPLILETAEKVQSIAPENAQTGPAVRGDTELIDHHLHRLEGRKKEIYALLSQGLMESND